MMLNGSLIDVRKFGARGDGVTDDRPAITAALSVLESGGTLYFPPGEYLIASAQSGDTGIVLPSGCNLYMDGGAWLISTQGIFNPTSGGSFIAPLGDNVITCNIDGRGYPTTGGVTGTWEGWANVGIRGYVNTTIGLGARNVVVRDSEIKNVTYPIQIYGAQSWRVYGNRFHRYRQTGILAGYYQDFDCRHNVFSGNVFEDAGDYAIAFFQVGGELAGEAAHNVVANNTAKDMNQRASGYAFGVEQGDVTKQHHFLFANNTYENTVTTGASGQGGITVSTCSDSVVTGNVLKLAYNSLVDTGINCIASVNVLIEGNSISQSMTHAINTDGSRNVTVARNTIHNCGGTVINYSAVLLALTRDTDGVIAEDNTLTVDSTHPHYGPGTSAIFAGSAAGKTLRNVTICGNTIINPNDQGITIAGTAAIPVAHVVVTNNRILGTQDPTFFQREPLYLSNCQDVSVRGNSIRDARRGLRVEASDRGILGENEFRGTTTIATLFNITGSTNLELRNNDVSAPVTTALASPTSVLTNPANGNRATGNAVLVTESRGKTASITSGSTVAHGLSFSPSWVSLTPASESANAAFVSATGPTSFTVRFNGGGSKEFYWEARL